MVHAMLLAALLVPAAAPTASAGPTCSIDSAMIGELGPAAPEVSTEQLRKILADGSATVFDSRPSLEFAMGHIPGARNVSQKPGSSAAEYVSDAAEVARLTGGKKDGTIVLYCNGPFCGKSKRLAADLTAAGFTKVLRYQLGIPVWRALGGVTQVESDGARRILEGDRTAVWLDARPAAEHARGTVPGAKPVSLAITQGGKDNPAITAAKNDGTLPMNDHNTRVIVFGATPADARKVAETLAHEAFHNVAFFAGSFDDLERVAKSPAPATR